MPRSKTRPRCPHDRDICEGARAEALRKIDRLTTENANLTVKLADTERLWREALGVCDKTRQSFENVEVIARGAITEARELRESLEALRASSDRLREDLLNTKTDLDATQVRYFRAMGDNRTARFHLGRVAAAIACLAPSTEKPAL